MRTGGVTMTELAQFEPFVRSNSGALFRTAFLLTGNRGAAEELVQDTLVHLYPKWHLVSAAPEPVAYVRRSIANRYVSGVRSRSSRDVLAWELPDQWDGRDLSQGVADRATGWQLVGTLPHRQRAAIVLRYFHDLDTDQVADALGCSPGTARSLISRGLDAMRKTATVTGMEGRS
jgi:RNA polymerase sigma-70 factor (sigma-E family)